MQEEISTSLTLKEYIIILNFGVKSKSYSFHIPSRWNFSKLKSFIYSTFEIDIGNSIPSLVYQGKVIANNYNKKPIKDLFKSNEIIKLSIILDNNKKSKLKFLQNVNSKTKSNLNEKKIKQLLSKHENELMETELFDEVEKKIMKEYKKAISDLDDSKIQTLNEFNELDNGINSNLFSFPIMSDYISERANILDKKDLIKKFYSQEIEKIENFPFKDYFNITLIFRLIILLVLFRFNLRGFKLMIFVSFLIIYYWYTIYCNINKYYDDKKNSIKLTEKELNEAKLFDPNKDFFISDFKKADKKLNNLNIFNHEINDLPFDFEINSDIDEETLKNIKEELNKSKSDNLNNKKIFDFGLNANNDNLLNNQRNILINNSNKDKKEDKKEDKLVDSNNKINKNYEKELMDRYEQFKKEKKEKEEKEEKEKIEKMKNDVSQNNEDNHSLLNILYKLGYTYVISMVPSWSDEFEANNPFPNENNNNNNNNSNIVPNNGNNNVVQNNASNNINVNPNEVNRSNINGENVISNENQEDEKQVENQINEDDIINTNINNEHNGRDYFL